MGPQAGARAFEGDPVRHRDRGVSEKEQKTVPGTC